MSSYRDWLYNHLGGSSSGGIMEDVIYHDPFTDVVILENIEGGKRYICHNETRDELYFTVKSVEDSPLESEIVLSTDASAFGIVASFPDTLGWIGEPSFEVGKSYIINIRNNVAVCSEYTPGVE